MNPGLGFRPLPDDPDEGSLIWYEAKNQTQVKIWTDRLDTFLERKFYYHQIDSFLIFTKKLFLHFFLTAYRNKSMLPSEGKNQVVCDFEQKPNNNKVCAVEVDSWGPCSPNEGYSYNKSSPCIFLKLNRVKKPK